MVDNEKILAGVEVLNEFKDKLTALCKEYRDKVQAVCPENQYDNYKTPIALMLRMQFRGDEDVTQKYLEENGYTFSSISSNGKSAFYDKDIDGIEVTYVIDAEEVQNET